MAQRTWSASPTACLIHRLYVLARIIYFIASVEKNEMGSIAHLNPCLVPSLNHPLSSAVHMIIYCSLCHLWMQRSSRCMNSRELILFGVGRFR